MRISHQFEYDLFISHASEDKESFVNPLADRLSKMGLRVWYDTHSLDIGDSLRRSIDKGLSSSRFGLVILSHAFFKKEWPQKELDAFISLESEGVFRIIPIWHELSKKELSSYSPLLADRVGIKSSIGIESLALIRVC